MIRLLVCTSLLMGLGLCGCSKRAEPPKDEAANLRKICRAYDVIGMMRNRGARDLEELRTTVKDLGDQDADAILRSPRDGQPYAIIYGVPLDSGARSTVLAYEKNGVEGKRFVLMVSRDVKELTAEEFAAASFARDQKPAKGK